jgi:2,5-dihydroxypyridine 5,6-dioxygenase
MQLCNVKKGETIAIVSDLNSRRDYVAAAFAAASELGANIYEMCVNSMPSWTKMGVETIGQNKGTLEALCKADMLIMLHIPLFTKWLKVVRDAGARVLLVIDAPQMLQPLLSQPGLKEATVHAGNRLGSAKEMRVLSDAGTDLRVSLGEYPVMVQYGFAESPGRYDRWGGGIVHTFPSEGTSNGTVVVQPGDIVILPYCRYVQDQIKLEIRDGFIRKIEGSLDAKLMHNWLEDNKRSADDMDGHAISHLGWGVNPNARWDNLALLGNHDLSLHTGSSRVFAGNFLFSTGPNTQGGGKRNTKGHYDIPMLDCTVLLDNDVIIDHGKIVDPKMMVERTQ